MPTLSNVEKSIQLCAAQQDLRAWTHIDEHGARASAVESESRLGTALERPLEGVVVGVKDNISVKGMPLTCASNMLRDFQPLYDATVVERLRDAGAVLLGKTNMDEFAMGSSNETSAFGPVAHHLDPERVPGGSSGGSAVAVAAHHCDVALGSDTGGSVRQPAAFCGVYGLKPTYGRLSRHGLVAFASSLDQVGIFTRDLHLMARTFDVLAAHDPMDATSSPQAAGHAGDAVGQPPTSFTFGYLPDHMLAGCDEEIRSAYQHFLATLEKCGGTGTCVELPHLDLWIPTYFILATAEASSNLARYDGVRYGHRAESGSDMTTASRSEGFGTEVKRRLMLGPYVLSAGHHDAFYTKAQQARRLIFDSYTALFASVDVLAMPTTPTTAFKRGAITDPVQMWLSDLYTVSANIAGIPALSMPFGTDSQGLPIGMQLQAAMHADENMMAIAEAVAGTIAAAAQEAAA